jgi:tripartite ATP-independent transporter DctM subunit
MILASLILIGGLFWLVLWGIPIAFALALISTLMILVTPRMSLWLLAQRSYAGLDSFVLLAVPFFLLAGKIMEEGGVSERLMKLATPLVGHIKGGLAHVTVVVGMFFAGISGSSTAEAASLATVFVPAMLRRGFDIRFATSLAAASSVMGVIIPPSILMVIYGAVANVSVGSMLVGGILPGVLVGLSLMGMSYLFAIWYDLPREADRWMGFGAILSGLKECSLALLIPFIIVGGITGGVFTPTEAAAVAAAYSLLLVRFVYRSLTWSDLWRISTETALTSAVILFCVATATVFGYLLAYYRFTNLVTQFFSSMTRDPYLIISLIIILFIILGTFLDATPAMLIFVPIVQPVAVVAGIHPVHLGVVIVMTLAFGLLTLPYGLCTLTACAIAKVPLSEVLVTLHILMVGVLAIILLSAYWPTVVMLLPRILVPQFL